MAQGRSKEIRNSNKSNMNLWNYGNVIEFLEKENEINIEINNFKNEKTDELIKKLSKLEKKNVKNLTLKKNYFKVTLN